MGGGGLDEGGAARVEKPEMKHGVHDVAKIQSFQQDGWYQSQHFQVITELLTQPFILISKIIFILLRMTWDMQAYGGRRGHLVHAQVPG